MIDTPSTNPSIFMRLRQTDVQPREMAWTEFHDRYAPMIAGFTRRLHLDAQDVDDVVQDVMIGFFSKSPTFQYDPSKGRFRGYLKVCTRHAVQKRIAQRSREPSRSLNVLDEVAIDQAWEDVWELQLLSRAVESIRQEMQSSKTFLAFEQFVIFEKPADVIAADLELHLNSVYRARDQVLRQLQQRLADIREEAG